MSEDDDLLEDDELLEDDYEAEERLAIQAEGDTA